MTLTLHFSGFNAAFLAEFAKTLRRQLELEPVDLVDDSMARSLPWYSCTGGSSRGIPAAPIHNGLP